MVEKRIFILYTGDFKKKGTLWRDREKNPPDFLCPKPRVPRRMLLSFCALSSCSLTLSLIFWYSTKNGLVAYLIVTCYASFSRSLSLLPWPPILAFQSKALSQHAFPIPTAKPPYRSDDWRSKIDCWPVPNDEDWGHIMNDEFWVKTRISFNGAEDGG